tara:strand:- start:5786 stop:6229 length:444 start_codon:yes stop_codon:yes gene_type:complete
VLESRSADAGRSVRRRRECLNCNTRFTTYERVESVPISVIKSNGIREVFDRSKLLNVISIACEKTNVSNQSIELFVDEIELNIQQTAAKEIKSSEIIEIVLLKLKNLNEIAFIRFASIYREFNGIKDFIEILEILKPNFKDELASML